MYYFQQVPWLVMSLLLRCYKMFRFYKSTAASSFDSQYTHMPIYIYIYL